MAKRRSMTLSEHREALEKDPTRYAQYLARVKERDERIAKLGETVAADEALLVREIRAQGYRIKSVWDLVNNKPHPVLRRTFTGSYEKAYPVLVNHLRVSHHLRVREGIIRALIERKAAGLAGPALLRELKDEPIQELRWIIAYALRKLMPAAKRKSHPEIEAAYRAGSGL